MPTARTYTTTQGDTWDRIAYALYGDEHRMSELIKANIAHAETLVFSAGVVLAVPEQGKAKPAASLPPWRR